MYNVEILEKKDNGKREPYTMPHIRTLSFTGARILVTDQTEHIYIFDPDALVYIEIRKEVNEA